MKKIFIMLLWGATTLAQVSNPVSETVLPEKSVKYEFKPTIKLSAEADFFFELGQQPSSIRGQTAFDFALLQVSPEIKIDDDLSLAFRFELTEERSVTKKNYMGEMKNAFIRYQDHQFKSLKHELGLFRSAWVTEEGQARQLDLFGDSGKSFSRRYGFTTEADLGYQAKLQYSERWLLVFSVANGEENNSDEQGPNKEVFLGAFYKGPHLTFQLGGSAGRVDRLDTKLNEKNRAFLRVEKPMGRFTLGLEALYAQDSSIDLENNKRVEGITFTELTDPIEIKTFGGRLDVSYDLSDKQRLVLRGDQVTPKWARKSVKSLEAAWLKQESPRMKWGAFYEKTDFGAQHSSQSKVREIARLGVEIVF